MNYEIIEDIVQGPRRRKRRVWILIPGGLDEQGMRETMAVAVLDLNTGFEEIQIEAYQDYEAVRYAGWVAKVVGSPARLTFDNSPPLRRDLMNTYR